MRDAGWGWRELTFEIYERLFARSTDDLAELASDDPDLSGFRERGGKLLLTHGADDQAIPAMGVSTTTGGWSRRSGRRRRPGRSPASSWVRR